MLSIINTKRKIEQHSDNRQQDDKENVGQGFGTAARVVEHPHDDQEHNGEINNFEC